MGKAIREQTRAQGEFHHYLGVVILQRPQQDEGDESAEEDDHHEGVEDGEPVDLVLEEAKGYTSKASEGVRSKELL